MCIYKKGVVHDPLKAVVKVWVKPEHSGVRSEWQERSKDMTI